MPHRLPVRFAVCFSPQADLFGGVAVTAIGTDACRRDRGTGRDAKPNRMTPGFVA